MIKKSSSSENPLYNIVDISTLRRIVPLFSTKQVVAAFLSVDLKKIAAGHILGTHHLWPCRILSALFWSRFSCWAIHTSPPTPCHTHFTRNHFLVAILCVVVHRPTFLHIPLFSLCPIFFQMFYTNTRPVEEREHTTDKDISEQKEQQKEGGKHTNSMVEG